MRLDHGQIWSGQFFFICCPSSGQLSAPRSPLGTSLQGPRTREMSYHEIEGRPLFGGNYQRARGGLQKRENMLKSGPVTVNSRAVIQIRVGGIYYNSSSLPCSFCSRTKKHKQHYQHTQFVNGIWVVLDVVEQSGSCRCPTCPA